MHSDNLLFDRAWQALDQLLVWRNEQGTLMIVNDKSWLGAAGLAYIAD